MRIGSNQLRTLIMTASPTCVLLTPGKNDLSLAMRGLMQPGPNGAGLQITAAGLRALADEMDAGRVDTALGLMRKDVARAKARMNART